MKFLLYTSLAFLVLALCIAGVYFFFLKQPSRVSVLPDVSKSGSLPTVSPASPAPNIESLLLNRTKQFPQGDTVTIQTSNGGMRVSNFYKSLVDTEEGSIILRETDAYQLQYAQDSSVFSIVVYGSPFQTVRKTAEQELAGLLGISQSDACTLSVKVVPVNDPLLQGHTLPLSFCPGN